MSDVEAKSFQIDLGKGQRLTGAGRLVVILAASATFATGDILLDTAEALSWPFDRLISCGIAISVGATV